MIGPAIRCVGKERLVLCPYGSQIEQVSRLSESEKRDSQWKQHTFEAGAGDALLMEERPERREVLVVEQQTDVAREARCQIQRLAPVVIAVPLNEARKQVVQPDREPYH